MRSGVEEYLDSNGSIVVPDGATVTAFLDRRIAEFGDDVAYRYLDFSRDSEGRPLDLTWGELGSAVRAVGARLQQISQAGDRVAICAPQGIEYVIGFFAAIAAGNIAVPLFTPDLPGHGERLEAVFADAQPSVVLTTNESAAEVNSLLRTLPRQNRPRVIAVDALPASVGATLRPAPTDIDEIAYLQYTSGSTRTPVGVEITHRAVCTNVIQMVAAGGLDTTVRSVSWLPLHHDMGLVMIMFPALCGGRITFMSPLAFVRRPARWIKALAAEAAFGRTFAAAPNFAFTLTAQRGVPPDGESLDLSNVVGLLNGSEPVTMAAIDAFTDAFAPYGLPPEAVKPSYGMAEATLSVASIAPGARASAVYLDREHLGVGRATQVAAGGSNAVAHVSCGQVIPSQWAVIADSERAVELPDGQIGEIWLHGNNVGRGYWGRELETKIVFHNKLHSRLDHGSHADGTGDSAVWLRTGDLGVFLDRELYLTGRIKDLIILDGRNHYPQDLEATVSESSKSVRSGYVAAFAVPANELRDADTDDTSERVVIVAERAAGAGRADHAPVIRDIRAAVSRTHGVAVADILLVAAGTIPRTTSGKLARSASRTQYTANAAAVSTK